MPHDCTADRLIIGSAPHEPISMMVARCLLGRARRLCGMKRAPARLDFAPGLVRCTRPASKEARERAASDADRITQGVFALSSSGRDGLTFDTPGDSGLRLPPRPRRRSRCRQRCGRWGGWPRQRSTLNPDGGGLYLRVTPEGTHLPRQARDRLCPIVEREEPWNARGACAFCCCASAIPSKAAGSQAKRGRAHHREAARGLSRPTCQYYRRTRTPGRTLTLCFNTSPTDTAEAVPRWV
jgi:hypothetical protein